MWDDKKVSAILPTYNERDSIRDVIGEILASGVVDEVVVVDNNAVHGTRDAVEGTGARLVHEPRQGYGWSCRRGLAEAVGDILILIEPDGTFIARDVIKLLAYSAEFDLVLGTRTTRELIWSGANMGSLLRWGNWSVAKLIEVLFGTSSLSDVGCTLRLVHRAALEEVMPTYRVGGNHFSPEMIIASALRGHRIIQIPVNYRRRVGESMVTGDISKAALIGLRMILLILRYRIASALRRGRPVPAVQSP